MALTLIPLDEVPAGLDVMPLGTKGEIAAFVALALATVLADIGGKTPVIHGVTASQVQGIKKGLKDAGMTDAVTIQTLSRVTGSRTYGVTRTKKDGESFSYEVTRDVRERFGVYLERTAL